MPKYTLVWRLGIWCKYSHVINVIYILYYFGIQGPSQHSVCIYYTLKLGGAVFSMLKWNYLHLLGNWHRKLWKHVCILMERVLWKIHINEIFTSWILTSEPWLNSPFIKPHVYLVTIFFITICWNIFCRYLRTKRVFLSIFVCIKGLTECRIFQPKGSLQLFACFFRHLRFYILIS